MISIFVAAERGDAKTVDQALARLPEDDYEMVDYKGRTPMHLAVEHGHYDVVEVLIRHSKSYPCPNNGGFTALHLAVHLGHDKIVARLLEDRPRLAKIKSSDDRLTCLHLAAARGHTAIVKLLLEKADVEDRTEAFGGDWHTKSAMDLAEAYGHMEALTVLVESVKSSIDEAKRAFEHVVQYGSEQAATQLLAQNPELANAVYGRRSALHLAADMACHTIVHQLLAMRPHLAEVGGCYRMSLLHFAAYYGYDTLVAELLVEKPHLIDATDEDGKGVLHAAANSGHKKVVSQLLAAKPALANQQDSKGRIPLHYAAENEDEAVVALLLAHNPELVDARDYIGNTPLQLTIQGYRKGMDTVAGCLLAHGATGVDDEEILWRCLVFSKSAAEDETAKLLLARKPELIRSVHPETGETVLHFVFYSRRVFVGMFREDFMLQCYQMYPEALHKTDKRNDTPFTHAVRSNNKFAIELVRSKVALDEIVEAYAKCKKQCPPLLDSLREPLLQSLNEDVIGVVWEYISQGLVKQGDEH